MSKVKYKEIIESLISRDDGRVTILDEALPEVTEFLVCLEHYRLSAMWLDYTGTITSIEELFYSFGIATREYWSFGHNINTLGDYLASDLTIPQNGCMLFYGNATPFKKQAPDYFDALIRVLKRESRVWQSKGVFFGTVIIVPDD